MSKPNPELFSKIMCSIRDERRSACRRRLIFYFSGFIISLIALPASFVLLRNNLVDSGFLNFFSLIFSDFETVTAYWQGFALTLLESLPVLSLIVFLGVILVFLESLKYLSRDLKNILSPVKSS